MLLNRSTLGQSLRGVQAPEPGADDSPGTGGDAAANGGSGTEQVGDEGNGGNGHDPDPQAQANAKVADLERQLAAAKAETARVVKESVGRKSALQEYGGITPEEAQQLKADREAEERRRQEERGEYDKIIAQEKKERLESEAKHKAEVERLRRTQLHRDILAASSGVIESFGQKSAHGGDPLIVKATEDMFRWDEEKSDWVEKSSGEDVATVISRERAESLSHMFQSQLKPGPGGERGEAAQAGKVVVIPRNDHEAFRAAEEQGLKPVFAKPE